MQDLGLVKGPFLQRNRDIFTVILFWGRENKTFWVNKTFIIADIYIHCL